MIRRSAVVGALLFAALLVLSSCSNEQEPDATPGRATELAAETIEAGEVTVKIDPVTIDGDGATFKIVLDTHSVELDMDIAKVASLEVDGMEWTNARWDGDGPSGHHREGTLTFEAVGDATGSARLTLDGFPESVRATWSLSSG